MLTKRVRAVQGGHFQSALGDNPSAVAAADTWQLGVSLYKECFQARLTLTYRSSREASRETLGLQGEVRRGE